MKVNINLYNFKKKHKKKINQIIFHKANYNNNKIIDNIINIFLKKKIVLFLNLLKKEKLEGDIQL